jgi:lipoprotein-anchoring transpeptidase ErfK/SrfK
MDPTGDNAPEGVGEGEGQTTASLTKSATDPLAAHDPAVGQTIDPAMADDQPRPMMQAQVVLDRLGFTPGVVDGKEGLSTRNAVMGYQEANGLKATGEFDEATAKALGRWNNIPATRVITIPAAFAAGPFAPLPEEAEDQARLRSMSYETLDEKLAERFHTTVEVLQTLNPRLGTTAASPSGGSYFREGDTVRVPNVGADVIDAASVRDADWRNTLASLGVGSGQPKAEKIVVSKSKGTLKAYDEGGKLVGMFTATMGSQHDPLPLGRWKVLGTAYNPPFHYNPKLFWDVPNSEEKQLLPPGPNGPVGVAWIDINKEHYGIHGTPDPETIGRAQSHGCVRLTNWDVARLAQMVTPGTQVLFEA